MVDIPKDDAEGMLNTSGRRFAGEKETIKIGLSHLLPAEKKVIEKKIGERD